MNNAQLILLETGWTKKPTGFWVDEDGCTWAENEALKAQAIRDYENGIVWERVKDDDKAHI